MKKVRSKTDPTAARAIGATKNRRPLDEADQYARRVYCLQRGDFRGAELFRRGLRLDV